MNSNFKSVPLANNIYVFPRFTTSGLCFSPLIPKIILQNNYDDTPFMEEEAVGPKSEVLLKVTKPGSDQPLIWT